MRRGAVAVAVTLSALTLSGPAAAHEGGKAEPRIAAAASGNAGTVRVLTVQLTDIDSGRPIQGAAVGAIAEMASPHLMRTEAWRLPEGRPGIYQARAQFPMPAAWQVRVTVTGKEVVSATAQFDVRIERGPEQPASASGAPELTLLPTRIEDTLGQRDLVSMAVLWLHGLAAVGWIVGVLVMLVGLSSGLLAEGWRARLRDGYRHWGAWAHWSLVPVIVGTGIYQMAYVTPFPLAWRPEQIRRLADIPYGPLYEAILIVKLGLFGALLITGTQVLHRTVRREALLPNVATNPHPPGFVRTLVIALGPPGILYLATVPLILAAAMALRYVHILSHVANVLQTG